MNDMLADTKSGIAVKRLLGAGQSNILGRDCNANALLRYRGEKGKIIGSLKNTVINGNVYTVLRKDEALGNDSCWVGGSLRVPSVCCPKISVATKD